ncbi:MAG: hypothetical protein ABR606_10495 [Vicinamibacterales bacterium]
MAELAKGSALDSRWWPYKSLALFVGLAVLHTWPLATDPARLSRLDNNDTAFNTWVVSWVSHQATRNPLHLFQAPIFHPERDTLAYSEHMFVPSMMGAPLHWAGASPVLVYNLLVMAGLALSGWTMALVLRQWTGSAAAGVIGGALFAFNAHLLVRFPHLQAQHLEFLPLAVAALDRLLTRHRAIDAIALATAFVLQALCSNYTMVFLAFALAAAVAVRPDGWLERGRRTWPLLVAAAALSLIVLLPFLLPYQRVHAEQGLVRPIEEVARYSAGWPDYLTTGGRLHLATWSAAFTGQTALFPGLTALGLTLVALGSGRACRDRRARMTLAFGLLGLAFSFGVHLPGYTWLHAHVLPLQGIRVVGRWGLLTLTAVAVLAAFGATTIQEFWSRRRLKGWPVAAAALLALATLEALRAPLGLVPFDGIPRIYDRLARSPDVAALVIFPLYPGGNFNLNAPYLLAQTRHFRPMVNGYSSFAPATFHARANRLQAFPAPAALDELQSIGVTDVLLYRQPLEASFGAAALETLKNVSRLEYVLEEDGVIWYRLR